MSETQTEKLELLEWMATLNDQSLIRELIEWKRSHQRVSISQYNEELEQSDSEISQGKFSTHEEAVTEIRSWREN
ncbi:MAG: hypothetical protein RIF33_01275 [Cyclobacteriaceae bacterium]